MRIHPDPISHSKAFDLPPPADDDDDDDFLTAHNDGGGGSQPCLTYSAAPPQFTLHNRDARSTANSPQYLLELFIGFIFTSGVGQLVNEWSKVNFKNVSVWRLQDYIC